jgi:hypothetical protein
MRAHLPALSFAKDKSNAKSKPNIEDRPNLFSITLIFN